MNLTFLKQRSLVVRHTRDFFIDQGYIEVDTPIRCPRIIPEAHIDPVASGSHWLQASPELCMKRLISQGMTRIFQICKCFRQGERGAFHLPEMSLLEWYGAGQTYMDLMDQCQDLMAHIARNLGMGHHLTFQGHCLDLSPPFERISVAQAFEAHASISVDAALAQDRFEEVLSFEVEPRLGLKQPCFLYDYPACLASLAALNPENPSTAQRFELYAAGIELANGFTELTDPDIQRKRFIAENNIREQRGANALELPEKFLADLATMPDTAGIALGLDRLVMLFCDAPGIDQVVAFTPESL